MSRQVQQLENSSGGKICTLRGLPSSTCVVVDLLGLLHRRRQWLSSLEDVTTFVQTA